jgi:hypothetical protein
MNGDPVNYMDPDGRFFSPVYQATKPTVLKIGSAISNAWHSPQFQGSIQAFYGFAETSAGGLATFGTGGLAAPVGWPVMAHGLDQFITGMSMAITGTHRTSATEQLLQKTGLPPEWASFANNVLSIGGSMWGTAISRLGRLVNSISFRLHAVMNTYNEGVLAGPFN